ncbi:hypothetical protein BXZ70DRAFT_933720 [Cristinia sonorae]|uniref:Uncharacterized protein n=1 Tax=Cristinia sonorae TaxID=1940300 RepID=A0A8K0UQ03_9AGAR|nr:hypothetical protein BXZ70DRAFT_933720 [Cristinia sonorae]
MPPSTAPHDPAAPTTHAGNTESRSESLGSETWARQLQWAPSLHAPPQDDVAVGTTGASRLGTEAISHHRNDIPHSNLTRNVDHDHDLLDNLDLDPTPKTAEDMRAKMALALEEHLHDLPESVQARYAHTLDIEGTSPKPCIVPGNALQLIDDDDRASTRSPPPIIIISNNVGSVNLNSSAHGSPPSDPETTGSSITVDQENPPRRPVQKVRFRSRVRITSGLRKHRHSTTSSSAAAIPIPGHQTPSTCSSCSGSPSSSISAPLRWHADENATWGPLGRRLSAYSGWQKRSPSGSRQGRTGAGGLSPRAAARGARADERTPLMSSQRARVAYVDSGLDGGGETDDERLMGGDYDDGDLDDVEDMSLRALALKREEDAVFGKWPWRLFNRHWWWWNIEPVLCCCADDSDYDEFQ